ncbi:MAG: class I SAM-dependent methyltransferase [Gemmatimonadaceae bacterium]
MVEQPTASPDGPSLSPDVPPAEIHRLVAGVEPASFRPILARCLAGAVSPQVALLQMVSGGGSAATVRSAVDEVTARTDADSRATDSIVRDRVDDLTSILVDHEDGVDRIVDMLRGSAEAGAPATVEEGIAFCERLFDWSVQQSEEASVALYSFGSPELLGRATDEVVALLDRWGVLGPDRSVLQIGCGIGRFERALASRVREVCGVDVSGEMVRAARRRCAGLANVRLDKSSGYDLSLYDDARFDLVYAVDTFPYLLHAGWPLVEGHFAEAHRVLRPGGDLVICNFSFRGDLDADRADVRRLAHAHGFAVLEDGVQPFRLWDGSVWRMERMERKGR